MPTAGRLAAAIAFALLGYIVAIFMSPYFEEGRVPNLLVPLAIVCGVLSGWVVAGKRAGLGYVAAFSNGVTAMTAMAFWILFLMSFKDMIAKSFRKLYDGPVEALVDVFTLMVDYIGDFAQFDLAIVLFAGGMTAGLFAEYFARRYP